MIVKNVGSCCNPHNVSLLSLINLVALPGRTGRRAGRCGRGNNRRGDHGGVVGAELDGRVFDVDRQGSAQLAAQFLVGGDAAGDDNGGRLEIVWKLFSLIDQGFDSGVLESWLPYYASNRRLLGQELVRRKGEVFAHLALNSSQNGCLEAGEGKIVLASELGDR